MQAKITFYEFMMVKHFAEVDETFYGWTLKLMSVTGLKGDDSR